MPAKILLRLLIATVVATAALGAIASTTDRRSGLNKLVTAAVREGSVIIYSTTDIAGAAPLIAGFEEAYPGVRVDYQEMNSPEVYGRFLAETESDGSSADITWSSAMDLQLKLANDGYAQSYRSQHSAQLPDWAIWHDEAYGTTFEPAVFVYNRRLVPPEEVPQTHAEFAQLMRAKHAKYVGNVTTYDVERSAVGFLFMAQDSLAMPGSWEFWASLRDMNVELEANTATMMERIAAGKNLLGYNLIGSYALARAKRDPSLGVVLPRDYTLVMSRVMLIARKARHPSAAKLWLDFVLSHRGQVLLAERSQLFSIRTDVQGEFTAASLARKLGPSARPIQVGPGLLVFLDRSKHQELIRRWRQSVGR